MMLSLFRRLAVGLWAATAMLTGCGGSRSAIGALSAPASGVGPTTAQYAVVLTFNGDGAAPYGALLDYKSQLYGTTFNTGGGSESEGGTVFRYVTSHFHGELHGFGYGSGYMGPSHPVAGLISVNDKQTFYGTTWAGGEYGLGTVFSITTKGVVRTLHSFHSADGNRPYAGLVYVKGQLYGTTAGGGKAGAGTVFRLSRSGTKYRVLHSFGVGHNGCAHDGCFPYGGLTDVNGTLYGTTSTGGIGSAPSGTVFSIGPSSGTYSILHTFCPDGPSNCSDGTSPEATLLNMNGTLYGTTVTGGSNCQQQAGCGTVFSISPSGAEAAIYSFCASGLPLCADGEFSYSPLTEVDGTLYGMTNLGGQFNGQIYNRYYGGTVFSLTASGTETVLHSFGGNEYDGDEPVWSGLTDIGGTLYGTTSAGGNGPCYNGCGIVFSLTPAEK